MEGLPAFDGSIWGVIEAVIIIGGWYLVTRPSRNRLHNHVNEIREQVSNTHETNLRDDMDKVLVAVDRIDRRTSRIGQEQRNQGQEISDLRKQVGQDHARAERVIAKHHPEDL